MNETKPDEHGCLGNTIKVNSGHYVDLLDPDWRTIDVKSIAAALSKICRFGGHSPRFYSVAEHCVHAARLASEDHCSEREITAVLLHDAAEAYVGDMVKPLKRLIPDYQDAEHRLEDAIARKFEVDFEGSHNLIKYYDRIMLKAEKIALWPEDRERWIGFADTVDREVVFRFWSPEQAENEFLKQFLRLCPRKWSISTDEECYSGCFDSRSEAIEEGHARGEYPFWIGPCVEPNQPETYWNAEDWIEHAWCQEDYSSDFADYCDASKEQCEELESLVRPLMAAWLDRHGLRPQHFMIDMDAVAKIERSDSVST